MYSVFSKTFGGLNPQYYFRQLAFGLIFPLMPFLVDHLVGHKGTQSPLPVGMIIFMMVNSILYPYSRYVYESIINFIMGENIFFGNALVVLFCKMITMMLCWVFAIVIAPFGLAYLYYYHSR